MPLKLTKSSKMKITRVWICKFFMPLRGKDPRNGIECSLNLCVKDSFCEKIKGFLKKEGIA